MNHFFICQYCGKTFKDSKNPGRKPKFCSRDCFRAFQKSKRTTLNCQICGKSFDAAPWEVNRRDGSRKYCSFACKHLGHRKRVVKKCRQCGQPFEIVVCQKDTSHYCSKKCSSANRSESADPSKRSIFTCDWCGREFETWTYRQPRFCSRQCTSEFGARQPKPNARKPEIHITLECATCGKEYQTTTHQVRLRGSRFCSIACRGVDTADRMRGAGNPNWKGGISANEYGPNWEAQSRKAKRRDGYTCQVCGYQVDGVRIFDVHHIKPLREFNGDWLNANMLSNLISLCRPCHGKVEFGKIPCPPITANEEAAP